MNTIKFLTQKGQVAKIKVTQSNKCMDDPSLMSPRKAYIFAQREGWTSINKRLK